MPVFIIAEAGSNWRAGDPERDRAQAKALIDVAADAGADAVKFQTYRAASVYVANAGDSDYLAEAGIRKSITDIFRDLEMPYEMIPELADYCAKKNIEFMSSPFSVDDARAIDPFVRRHKLASYEISHLRLIQALAETGKPLIASTGAATEDDIAWFLETFRAAGGRDVTLLQCTAKYPAPLSTLNLQVLTRLRERFGAPVGLSDHSKDPVIGPAGAVALGATVIEKHYTLDRTLPGPDHSFALEPGELKAMVRAIRDMEASLGSGHKVIQSEEEELRAFARRGLQATRAIRKGDALQEAVNIDILRPGKQKQGLHPRRLADVQGKRATRDIPAGDGIQEGDFA